MKSSNNNVLYLLIAGMLAIIGFLIYYFFFSKKAKNDQLSAVIRIPETATNPITTQTVDKPVYNPVITMPQEGKQTSTSANTGTFESFQYEVLQEKKDKDKSLTERTNNPGAIFWDGSTAWQGLTKSKTKKGGIITFDNVDFGVRAQCMTLRSYSKKHGIKTLNALTARYAPLGHGNNNPVAYAKTLSDYCNLDPNAEFNLDQNRNLLAQIAYYIHRVEAGYFWVPRSKFIDWASKI